MGTRTTLQPVFESVKTDHTTTHLPHRHSTSKVGASYFQFYWLVVVSSLRYFQFATSDQITLRQQQREFFIVICKRQVRGV